jgi:uncharacterized protein (TIGR03435 family)
MKRALISACLSFGLAGSFATAANAQAKHSYQPVRGAVRVDDANVPYEARIEPTTMAADSTSIETGADHWSARGFDLKTLIAQIYDIDVRLVDLPEGAGADARYDVSLSLPTEVDQDAMQRLLADALRKKFGLTIRAESRAMDVYVLSAPEGPGTELHKHAFPQRKSGLAKLVGMGSADDADEAGGQITYMGRDCSGVTSGGITVSGGTISDFRRTLEPDLDRVLLDETKLAGSYDFKIGTYVNQDQLFQLLHEQLGLEVTPAQRNVTVLAVRPVETKNLQAKL